MTGIRLNCTVNQSIVNHRWVISSSNRNATICSLRQLLPASPPVLQLDQPDQYLWRSSASSFSSHFSCRTTWSLLHSPNPKVPWFKAVWIKPAIPKHSFLFWITVLRRLPTKDRMIGWGLDVNAECVLCRSANESIDHLFVHCEFVQFIWSRLLFIPPRSVWSSLDMLVNWSLNRNGDKERVQIERLLVQAIVYEVWSERNNRIHRHQSTTQLTIVTNIRRTIRNKLTAGPYSSSSSQASLPLLQKWYQVFQPSSSAS